MKVLTKQAKNRKEIFSMKLTKRKVLVLTLAVCLIAIASMSTLAWFTAQDEVTNNFYIANSEDDPDKIFSVDVWEDDTLLDVEGEKKLNGIEFENILPGDEFFKEVHIENTGSYDQYIRATITITDAAVWQQVFGERMVALEDFVNYKYEGYAPIHTEVAYYDYENDAFVYQLYYDKAIAAGQEIIVFDTVTINSALDQYQAAELAGSFEIKVVADAVQVENVGNNVYEAFTTVGLVKAIPVSSAEALADAMAAEGKARIIIDPNALENGVLTINSAVKDKTLDFAGADAQIIFADAADGTDVVITGIVDTDNKNATRVVTEAGFDGDVTVVDCSFVCGGTNYAAIKPVAGNITVDSCTFEGVGKSYAIYYSGAFDGNLTITDSKFENLGSWAIMINNQISGSVTIDKCVFATKDGVMKALSGVQGDFTFTNNTLIGVKGHDGKAEQILSVAVVGTKTVTGNTLDGEPWSQE